VIAAAAVNIHLSAFNAPPPATVVEVGGKLRASTHNLRPVGSLKASLKID
jgi:hypothetical protein